MFPCQKSLVDEDLLSRIDYSLRTLGNAEYYQTLALSLTMRKLICAALSIDSIAGCDNARSSTNMPWARLREIRSSHNPDTASNSHLLQHGMSPYYSIAPSKALTTNGIISASQERLLDSLSE